MNADRWSRLIELVHKQMVAGCSFGVAVLNVAHANNVSSWELGGEMRRRARAAMMAKKSKVNFKTKVRSFERG